MFCCVSLLCSTGLWDMHSKEPAIWDTLRLPSRSEPLVSDLVCGNSHLQLLPVPVAHPRPANPLPLPSELPESRAFTAFRLPFAPSLVFTPSTIFSRFVSTTTPPTTISLSTACRVSKPKIRSSSQTFSKSLSRASTKTWMKSSRASGDSVEVEIKMKYNVA